MSLSVPARPRRARPRWLTLDDANPLIPYLLLLPHALLFLAFIVFPIAFGVWVSVHRFDPVADQQPFVGLLYYRNLFDPSTPQFDQFWQALRNTAVFAVISVPLLVAYSLSLALQLHGRVPFRAFFRAVFFLPGILAGTVVGVLWRWLFDNQSGLVNAVLDGLGRAPIPFLTSEGLAWIPIIGATLWTACGFNMTVYLAALSGISASLYEAADLDGANGAQKFRFITWPMLAPTTLFVTVTSALGAFGLFFQSVFITGGGPNRSTTSVIQYLTTEAFNNVQYSSATAMSLVFAALLLTFTVVQFRLMVRDMTRGGR